jgi:hypothetical protein
MFRFDVKRHHFSHMKNKIICCPSPKLPLQFMHIYSFFPSFSCFLWCLMFNVLLLWPNDHCVCSCFMFIIFLLQLDVMLIVFYIHHIFATIWCLLLVPNIHHVVVVIWGSLCSCYCSTFIVLLLLINVHRVVVVVACEEFLHTFTIKICTHKKPVGSGTTM